MLDELKAKMEEAEEVLDESDINNQNDSIVVQ